MAQHDLIGPRLACGNWFGRTCLNCAVPCFLGCRIFDGYGGFNLRLI